jgi:protein-disulfide isomerase
MTLTSKADSLRTEIEGVVKEYLAAHPEEVQKIVKSYLIANPAILQDMLAELVKKSGVAPVAALPAPAPARVPETNDKADAIRANARDLLGSPHQMTLGNAGGDVTMVEFFDYNCGFCKRALSDMVALIRDNPKLKVVLKELPILGPGSTEAAQVAIAVRMQDRTGAKSLEFHQRVLGGRGQANKASALAAAAEIGLDMTQLERDMASDEVRTTLDESVKLARVLGINGTPGYVIGNSIVPGAIGFAGLKTRIDALARP